MQKLQPKTFSDFQSQTRISFICHSGLASSPAQNGEESGQTATIKSLPQQNVAMTNCVFCKWYSDIHIDMIAKAGLAVQYTIIVFLSDDSSVVV